MKKSKVFPSRRILVYVLIVSLVAFLLCTFSYVDKVRNDSGFCDITGSDCSTVQNSAYGSFLGLDLNILGIVCFSALIILSIMHLIKPRRYSGWLIFTGSLMAGMFAIYLIVIQVIILKQTCLYCILIDISSVVLMGLAIWAKMYRR